MKPCFCFTAYDKYDIHTTKSIEYITAKYNRSSIAKAATNAIDASKCVGPAAAAATYYQYI